jgi:hypothetical protein
MTIGPVAPLFVSFDWSEKILINPPGVELAVAIATLPTSRVVQIRAPAATAEINPLRNMLSSSSMNEYLREHINGLKTLQPIADPAQRAGANVSLTKSGCTLQCANCLEVSSLIKQCCRALLHFGTPQK